jgi:predicted Zn-dependent protease
MGRDVDHSLFAAHRFYSDSVLGRYVQEFGVRLAATSGRPGLPWTFRILDDPGVNAFAFPGGVVYVTRGMLAYLNSEAQLAGVLGHEIGHVAAGHAVDRSTRLGITGGASWSGRPGAR